MHILSESIPSTNIKIIELFNKIESGNLVLNPDFQRKLVWKKQHKYHFIETILMNYPFPEVYLASSDIDVNSITSKEIVVDGQQRLSTIVDYIKGVGDFNNQFKIKPFFKLEDEEKKRFLNYLVTVKDLKDMSPEVVKEIFKRINHTEYSLNFVEKTNAQYGDGEFILYSKALIEKDFELDAEMTDMKLNPADKSIINEFFNDNDIYSENDIKRMYALQQVMSIISTIIYGDYFSRFNVVNEFIEKYNKEFEQYIEITEKLKDVIEFMNKLNLDKKSYWFNKANIFTLIVELSKNDLRTLDPLIIRDKLLEIEELYKRYFAGIDLDNISDDFKKYFEFAKEGLNEKKAREHRGKVIRGLLN